MNIVNDVAMTTLAATAAILALHSMPCSASKSGTTWRHTTQNVVPGNQTEAWLLRPAHTPASTFTSSTDIHPPNKVKLALLRLTAATSLPCEHCHWAGLLLLHPPDAALHHHLHSDHPPAVRMQAWTLRVGTRQHTPDTHCSNREHHVHVSVSCESHEAVPHGALRTRCVVAVAVLDI
jgi:hypothetical protein